jgi:hypothetical protein
MHKYTRAISHPFPRSLSVDEEKIESDDAEDQVSCPICKRVFDDSFLYVNLIMAECMGQERVRGDVNFGRGRRCDAKRTETNPSNREMTLPKILLYWILLALLLVMAASHRKNVQGETNVVMDDLPQLVYIGPSIEGRSETRSDVDSHMTDLAGYMEAIRNVLVCIIREYNRYLSEKRYGRKIGRKNRTRAKKKRLKCYRSTLCRMHLHIRNHVLERDLSILSIDDLSARPE